MSRIFDALEKLIRELEMIGYSYDSALELCTRDIDKAKEVIENYYMKKYINDEL